MVAPNRCAEIVIGWFRFQVVRWSMRGEDVSRKPRAADGVQRVDVRHAATEYDDVGIENVDDDGQRATEAIDVPLERGRRDLLSGASASQAGPSASSTLCPHSPAM